MGSRFVNLVRFKFRLDPNLGRARLHVVLSNDSLTQGNPPSKYNVPNKVVLVTAAIPNRNIPNPHFLSMCNLTPIAVMALSKAGANARAKLMRKGRAKFCMAQRPA